MISMKKITHKFISEILKSEKISLTKTTLLEIFTDNPKLKKDFDEFDEKENP